MPVLCISCMCFKKMFYVIKYDNMWKVRQICCFLKMCYIYWYNDNLKLRPCDPGFQNCVWNVCHAVSAHRIFTKLCACNISIVVGLRRQSYLLQSAKISNIKNSVERWKKCAYKRGNYKSAPKIGQNAAAWETRGESSDFRKRPHRGFQKIMQLCRKLLFSFIIYYMKM